MSVLDSNIEYDSNVYDRESDKLITISFSCDKSSSVVVSSTKQIESKISENIDKQLVSEGKLLFEKDNDIKSIILSDDGMIELYENDKLLESSAFSKLNVLRTCKSIVQEGYTLSGSEEQVDADEVKSNIEQGIERVDELQDLKDELIDKVDNFDIFCFVVINTGEI